MKSRKPDIRATTAPAWLPKFAKAEWAPVVPALVKGERNGLWIDVGSENRDRGVAAACSEGLLQEDRNGIQLCVPKTYPS